MIKSRTPGFAVAHGLIKWENENDGIQYNTHEGYVPNSYRGRILELDQNGNFWFLHERGLGVWDGKGYHLYSFIEDRASIRKILVDTENDLWVGTDLGIFVLQIDENSRITKATQLIPQEVPLNELILSIIEDREGKKWIGTSHGLYVYDQKGIIRYTVEEGLSGDRIYSLFQDKNGSIWVGTNNGLNQIQPAKGIRNIPIQRYSQDEGFKGKAIQSLLIDKKERLWVGTNNGIEKITLNAFAPDTTKPKVHLKDLQPLFDHVDWRKFQASIRKGENALINGEAVQGKEIKFDSVSMGKNLPINPEFPHHINKLSFTWSCMYGSSPDKIMYSYLMEGQDRSWSPLVNDTKITFRGMRPGSYTFKVRAVSNNNIWSDTVTYPFTIRSPWYLSWWAYSLYALFGLLVMYFIRRFELQKQQQKLERERQLNDQLQRVDQLKDQFLANTSHELRTPLQGIIGLSESLSDRVVEPDQQEDLSMIISSGKRLNSLVNDILDFSKLKNYDIELLQKPVNLKVLVDIVLRNNAPLIKGKKMELINEIPEDLPAAEADENRLQQVLYNLVGNAIKFTEKGHVKISAREKDTLLQVEVEDTGIGIPASKRNTIFQEFEQANGTISREFAGTGLGLSISKKLVELHGGSMWVDSEVGKGSTFYFTLPKSKKQATTLVNYPFENIQNDLVKSDFRSSVPRSLINSNEGKIRILVVDDEPINQQVFKNHLSQQNFHLTQAMNGEEALRIIQNNDPFDLILLDVMMPRMSGYEVCEKIRQEFLLSELPVIMITAKNQLQDVVQGLSLGANDYLPKPFHKEELLARINTQLDLNKIHSVTGKFVPNEFLRSLGLNRITEVELGDQTEREVTVLFSDIRDYTSLSETMTPEENFKFVNAFNGRMGPIIKKHGGFVNQYLGDAIMAIFPGNPSDALIAAKEMQLCLIDYNLERISSGKLPLKMGIGLHTGPLIMGIIGDQNRMDAATISDTVNTTSRIESLTKYYGASILLSEDSLNIIESTDEFNFRYLGKVLVKGKKNPVGIYECPDGDELESKENKLRTATEFETGLTYFFDQNFAEAAASFNQVVKINPKDHVARLFLNKSARYIQEGVSKDWTGTESFDTK